MKTWNVPTRRQPDTATAMKLTATLAAFLSLTGCAVLSSGTGIQPDRPDGLRADAVVGVDMTCEAPMPVEPIEIVPYPHDDCAAPTGCAPLASPSVSVPPEMPPMAFDDPNRPDSAASIAVNAGSSTAGNQETAMPLAIPQYANAGNRYAPENAAYPNPYNQPSRYQQPQSRNSAAGPAPVTQCAPCSECLRLREETTELQEQVAAMQVNQENEREDRAELEDSLARIRQQLNRISDDVRYWQNEVRRIDEEAEQQHREDMESLEMLSKLVTRLPRHEKLPDVDVSIIEE